MTAPAQPLRVLQFAGDNPPTSANVSAKARENRARNSAAQALQKVPTNVQEWLVSFVTEWLQKHAGPAVQEWLDERTSRPILVSTQRAARLLDLSESTVSRMVADGHLPAVNVGARVLIRRTDLEAWAEGLPAREVGR